MLENFSLNDAEHAQIQALQFEAALVGHVRAGLEAYHAVARTEQAAHLLAYQKRHLMAFMKKHAAPASESP